MLLVVCNENICKRPEGESPVLIYYRLSSSGGCRRGPMFQRGCIPFMTPNRQPTQFALPLLKLIYHILTPLSTALIISTLSFLRCSHYDFSIRCFTQISPQYSLPNLHPLNQSGYCSAASVVQPCVRTAQWSFWPGSVTYFFAKLRSSCSDHRNSTLT